MSKTSRRFTPSAWKEKLVPVLLIILVLALLTTLVITGLAMLGVMPGA
jgi:hypothetical protein